MKSGRFLFVLLFAAIFLSVSLSGCQKKATEPEEIATSEAVVTEEEAAKKAAEEETLKMAEEESRRAVVEEAQIKTEEEARAKSSHTVVKGECLWCIAEYENIYNDPFQWPIIYKANRDQIKDPDLIHPEQVFAIPRDSSQGEIDAAVHEAKYRGPWTLWDGK